MKLLHHFVLLMVVATGALSQDMVTFCDLVHDPNKYAGKEVTVRASYKFGFEWSYLYCLSCLEEGKPWLELPLHFDDLDRTTRKAIQHLPEYAGTVNLTVSGVLVGPGAYGHMNGYRYEFKARTVSNVVVLIKGMKRIDEEKLIEQKCACGGANPK
jgi:hypothetical protein